MKIEPEGEAEAGVVCPKCLLANSPSAAFCADCGAPIGMVAAIDPIQRIGAEGFAYRSAVDGPPKLVIVIGMWLLFGPPVVVVPVLIFQCWESGFPLPGGLLLLGMSLVLGLLGTGSACILYRATKNYLVKSRSSR